MTLKYKFISLCSLTLILFSANSTATGPRVAPSLFVTDKNIMYAQEYAPFVSNANKQQGLLMELISSVLKAKGVAGTVNILPTQSMVQYYFSQEMPLAIIGPNFKLSKAANKKATFIPVLGLDKFFYAYQKGETKVLDWTGKLKSLKGKTYGANKSEDVTAYKQAGINIKYARTPALVKQLQQGKIDFIGMPEATFNDLNKQHSPEQVALFIKMTPKAGKMLMGITFNKNHPEGQQAAKAFKTGLKKLISSGQYQSILHKHLGGDIAADEFIKHIQ